MTQQTGTLNFPRTWAIRLAIKEAQHQTPVSAVLAKAAVIESNRDKVGAGIKLMSLQYDSRLPPKKIDLDALTLPKIKKAVEKVGPKGHVWQLLRDCVGAW